MIDLYYYILIWVFIIGLCFGSFYNVVILRTLSNESIVFPPSKCPKCKNKLYWWQNIPVLSYILLRGKCHFCKEKISIQYPIIELCTAIFFSCAYMKFGLSYETLFVLYWISCLIIMIGTDLKEKLVDCNIAIAMGVSGIIYNFIFFDIERGLYAIVGMIVAILILELIARSGYLLAGTRAMGEADTYVAGALGAIFGKEILLVLLTGFLFSMIFIIPIFFYHQYKSRNTWTCIYGILFTLTILYFQTVTQNYYSFALVLITGLGLVYFVLKGIRKQKSPIYLPYVPALAVGALYFIFFVI